VNRGKGEKKEDPDPKTTKKPEVLQKPVFNEALAENDDG